MDEARSYLQVNGYAPGDIDELMVQRRAAPVAKVMPESRSTPVFSPSLDRIADDEDDE